MKRPKAIERLPWFYNRKVGEMAKRRISIGEYKKQLRSVCERLIVESIKKSRKKKAKRDYDSEKANEPRSKGTVSK